jgi:hypothetical protein
MSVHDFQAIRDFSHRTTENFLKTKDIKKMEKAEDNSNGENTSTIINMVTKNLP